MKLKYKKLVMFVSLGTLFLSFLILSMVPNGGSGGINPEEAEVSQDEYKEINELVQKYFDAKLTVNMDAMNDLVSDPSQVDQNKLIAQQEYLEGYQNISCYVIANDTEDAFRVYVRYDMKIKNISTLAPSLSGLYVTITSDNSYRVYLSALDEEEEEFIESADKNMEVIKLKEEVAAKLNEALNADPNFKQFYDKIAEQNQAAAIAVSQAAVNAQQQPAQQQPAQQQPAQQQPAQQQPAQQQPTEQQPVQQQPTEQQPVQQQPTEQQPAQ